MLSFFGVGTTDDIMLHCSECGRIFAINGFDECQHNKCCECKDDTPQFCPYCGAGPEDGSSVGYLTEEAVEESVVGLALVGGESKTVR